jgi:hypothetical protein
MPVMSNKTTEQGISVLEQTLRTDRDVHSPLQEERLYAPASPSHPTPRMCCNMVLRRTKILDVCKESVLMLMVIQPLSLHSPVHDRKYIPSDVWPETYQTNDYNFDDVCRVQIRAGVEFRIQMMENG